MVTNYKWTSYDLSNALTNAVQQHAAPNLLRIQGNKIIFNGFWRNGDKQNVCIWLDKATWHDAKTGEGGGAKEFAKIAYNLSLPEFMDRFGSFKSEIPKINIEKAFNAPLKLKKTVLNKPVQHIYSELLHKDKSRKDQAGDWLKTKRGFIDHGYYLLSGFTNLDESDIGIFEPRHHSFIRYRLKIATQMIVPLRGVHSDEVKNLFFRSISECAKGEKSMLLGDAGGWEEPDGSPRAYGFPYLIHDFPGLIISEGMADYFATECLLAGEHKYLPIGAASASALVKWASWLAKTNYKGQVILLNQLDRKDDEISSNAIGQKTSTHSMKIFLSHNIKARFFAWHDFLIKLENSIDMEKVSDIADICALFQEQKLSQIFLDNLQPKRKNTDE